MAHPQTNLTASNQLDDSLQSLSVTSSTSKSDVLGGFYELYLAGQQESSRVKREEELGALVELIARLKGAVERLKSLEAPKKAFEAESKRYYDEVGKVILKKAAPKNTTNNCTDSIWEEQRPTPLELPRTMRNRLNGIRSLSTIG